MNVCLFILATPKPASKLASDTSPSAQYSPGASDIHADALALIALASSIDGILRAVVHTAVDGGVNDPYLHDAASPRYALQLYFDELSALEASIELTGPLQQLTDAVRFPTFAGVTLTQQAMAVRYFPVPDANRVENPGKRCTYLVSYEGEAEDYSAWIGHYVDSHPPIMARFPGIREIEIYTRLDYRSDLPAVRSLAMQRNKVVFDSPEALQISMDSPVRHEMRADFRQFPPFSGENFHYPMHSVYWAA